MEELSCNDTKYRLIERIEKMNFFKYNDEYDTFVAEIDGVRFCCEEEKDEYKGQACNLAEVYEERLPEIVSFILSDVRDMFGDITEDELADALGTPLIDLDREVVTYLEQTLDDCHIIDVEYGGLLEKLYEVSIDG